LRSFLDQVLPHKDGPRLPVVLWSRLLFDLRRYLTSREAEGARLITFFHRELGDVASDKYLSGRAGDFHGRLADYFRPGPGDDGARTAWGQATDRGLSELPFHLVEAQRWDEVEATLTDFDFLEAKATRVAVDTRTDKQGNEITTYLGVQRLQDDYDHALQAMGGGDAAGRPRIIVTATDFGQGMVVRCPHCNTVHTFATECSVCKQTHRLEDWVGKEVACSNPDCKGPLKVNKLTVGRERKPEPLTSAESQELPATQTVEAPAKVSAPERPVPPAPPPELPVASGAARLLDDVGKDGRPGVNDWLLALLRNYGPMAESLCPGLEARPLAAELANQVRAGESGDHMSREELIAAAARHAQGRGKDRVAERDLAVAILAAAGRAVKEAGV
jgi:hypothetical protein